MKIDVVGIRLVKEREIDYDKPIKKTNRYCEFLF